MVEPDAPYLHDIPLEQAQARLLAALTAAGLDGPLAHETIPLDERALGRVLAEPVWALSSSPHYHAAAMDGFAVRAADTAEAGPATPVGLGVGTRVRYVDTGDPLPGDCDAVIPIEQTEALNESGGLASDLRSPAAIRIRAAVAPWSHVRPLGEDMVATQLVLPGGAVLRPPDLGAIAAAGHDRVGVVRRPRVAILPTGTELVSPGPDLLPGQIPEFNSIVLAAQVNAWGGQAIRLPSVPDDLDAIREAVRAAAADCDLVLLNAGSSAGAQDYSAAVVRALGQLLVHGVAVRPGHPVILGLLTVAGRDVPLIGVPGYPVSAAMTGEIFVEPLLARWLGRPAGEPQQIEARLTRKVTSPAGDDDYLRVALGVVGGRTLAAPLPRGAGVISSLVRADGIVVLPRGVQGAEAGETVQVRLYRAPAEVERAIFCVGSHDLLLDLLAQFLSGMNRRLVSSNVGSQGGLIALRRGEAHLAGAHLLDPATGTYNLPAIHSYLPGVAVRVVALAERQQGLLVRRGNPLQLTGLADLTRPEVAFINRQPGAGTRVLLDYHLDLKGISLVDIRGYNQVEYTHLGVAAAVASGRADCGLGIAAAARALDLDFLPLFQERYDLVIPLEYAGSELLAPLIALLADANFRSAAAGLPGYDLAHMGKCIAEVLT